MPIHPATRLLLLSFLAAGCAGAGHAAARVGDGGAPQVRLARLSPRSLVVRLPEPAHAAILDVRSGAPTPARWLDAPGSRRLPAGSHTLSLATGGARPAGTSREQRACNGPGERPYFDLETARNVASAGGIREVDVRGARVYCVRSPAGARERTVVVVAAPGAVDDGLLAEVLAEFNARYSRVSMDAATLTRLLSNALTAVWPGSAAYSIPVAAS